MRALIPGIMKVNGFDNLIINKKIPDFSTLILKDRLNVNKIIEIINLPNTRLLRKWIHALDIDEESDILDKYISDLKKHYPGGSKIGFQFVCFLATKTITLAFPLAGPIFNVATLILPSIFRSWHPVLFIDELRKKVE